MDNINDPRKPNILIIDDDTQVASYLKSLFTEDYNVTNKYSGEAALKALETLEPDIILSDVIMGEMSGYELCQKIKEDRMLCHIPVILLTAKSEIEETLRGLSIGASAYITKPFVPEVLKAQVKTLLRNRDDLRRVLTTTTKPKEKISNQMSPQDQKFMIDLYNMMDEMIDQEDLNFNDIARKLLMGRSKFNYKLKALTGITPNNLFMCYKLNKAAELLKTGKYNISEVADMTGFKSLAHFSTSFKKHFEVPPSEYR